MTTNVTSPALYALGTVTTAVSFLVDRAGLGSHRPDPAPARAPRRVQPEPRA